MSNRKTKEHIDFEALFNATPVLYLILAPDFIIIEVNQAYLRATMVEREAILGLSVFEAFPDNPDDPHANGVRNLRASLLRALETKKTDIMAIQRYDIRKPKALGGGFVTRYWSVRNTPVLDKEEKIQHIIHCVEDVTEFVQLKESSHQQNQEIRNLKHHVEQMEIDIFEKAKEIQKTNQSLREKEAHLNLALQASQIATWVWDCDNDNITVDQFMAPLYGLQYQQQFPKHYKQALQLIHPDDRIKIDEQIQITLTTSDKFDVEYRIIWPDESVHVLAARGLIYEGDGHNPKRLAGICIDITEHVALRQEKTKLTQALEEKNRFLLSSNQMLEEFAYSVSHDLQEPLRMIGGFTDLLQRRYQGKLDEKADHYIHNIIDGVYRMQSLIASMLTYSRLNTQNKEKNDVDMNEALTWALDNLEQSITDSKAIIHSEKLPHVYGNKIQLGQLLQNLLSNAIHYRKDNLKPEISIEAIDKQDHWILSVKDNGVGIPPEYRERVFRLFQRINQEQEKAGNGIGLAICKRVVQNHNGTIWLESEANQGTTFFFTLPKQTGDSYHEQ